MFEGTVDGPRVGAGFKVTFESGYTVSVQWHKYAYCSGRDYSGRDTPGTSVDAEVAVWDAEGTWVHMPDGDSVYGYATAEEVASIMSIASHGGSMSDVTMAIVAALTAGE